MFTYLNRLRNHKGFTLIEVVIVVAIVGIMSAVAVPNAIASQRRAEGQRHNEHARSFYFALQQTLISVTEFDNTPHEFTWSDNGRVSGTNSLVSSNNNFWFYVVVNDDGIDVNASVMAFAARNTPTFTGTIAANNVSSFNFLMNQLRGFMPLGTPTGSYWAMVDSNFRVIVTYYSRFGTNTDTAANFSNASSTQDNRITDNNPSLIFGAFPHYNAFTTGSVTPRSGSSGGTNGSNRYSSTWWGDGTAATIPGA
ncbi:MAG: prepilin-type N-terminal cleavage/methylation domain-containing protein [Oscillospiraceae bacterium]|nr:prepilin-type N-terminal cleavage/methylation domain-containing protein [Oscillospiraceae bacterium]